MTYTIGFCGSENAPCAFIKERLQLLKALLNCHHLIHCLAIGKILSHMEHLFPKAALVSVPKDISSGTGTNIDTNLINPLPSKTSYLDAVCDQVGQGLQAFFSS